MKCRRRSYIAMKTKITFIILITFLVLNSILIVNSFEKSFRPSQLSSISDYPLYIRNGLSFPFVNINGNIDLASWASSGNGTATNPYIIENILLNDCPPVCYEVLLNYGPCIAIQNTDKHFILRNCRICTNNCNSRYNIGGIDFINVSNAEISNNSIYNVKNGGINLQNSHNITIKDNTLFYKRLSDDCYSNCFMISGIWLDNSFNINLFNNTITNSYCGIDLQNSNNNGLINNSIYRNFYGIILENSSNNTIIQNSLVDNRKGLSEDASSNGNIIVSNTISDINDWINFLYFILIPILIALGLICVIYLYFRKKDLKRKNLSR